MALSRRALFRHSVDELVAAVEECHGHPSFRLSDLGTLPDDRFARLIPAITDASNVRIEAGRAVLVRAHAAPVALFDANSVEADVWSRIDARTTVRGIADGIAGGQARAFERVRSLVLLLVRHGICQPCNPLE
jgi:hypothetical protein